MGALVVAPTTGTNSENFALLRLLLGGIGNDQTRSGGLLGLVGLDDNAVIEGLEIHWCGPPWHWHCVVYRQNLASARRYHSATASANPRRWPPELATGR